MGRSIAQIQAKLYEAIPTIARMRRSCHDLPFGAQRENIMAVSSKLMTAEAERRFPCRIKLGIPTGVFGAQLTEMHSWLDENCGADGWVMTPARLHQASFRDAVLAAYRGRCAISRLPEPRLLDAAHIIMDANEQLGQPIIPNGLPLTKIHHAAFDAHLIGIDPDFRVHVSDRLLEIHDGPFLFRVGLPNASQMISVPSSVKAPSDTSQILSLIAEASSKIKMTRRPLLCSPAKASVFSSLHGIASARQSRSRSAWAEKTAVAVGLNQARLIIRRSHFVTSGQVFVRS